MRSWVLVLTHAILLGVSGFGLWVAVSNFGKDHEILPPTPPPTTTTTTTTPSPGSESNYYGRSSDYHQNVRYEDTNEYRSFLRANRRYASIMTEPRLYVAGPCGIVAINSLLMVVAGLVSSKMFATTASLYSSVMLWASTLTATITYQINFNASDHTPPTVAYVVGIQVALLFVLMVQVMLSMWELRRQKSNWPTINFSSLFTFEIILLAARWAFAVLILIGVFSYDNFLNGLRKLNDDGYVDWDTPRDPYPLWLGLSIVIAVFYNLVVVAEITLSTLTGTVQKQLAWITTLITAIGNGWVAVLLSPVFVQTFIGPYNVWAFPLIFATTASIVAFVHTMGYLVLPDFLRTPPRFIPLFTEWMSTLTLQDFVSNIPSLNTLSALTRDIGAGPKKRAFAYHAVSLFVNFVSMFILCFGIATPMSTWRSWGATVVFSANVAGILHSFPPVFLSLCFHQTVEMAPFVERAIRHMMELVLVIIGSIAVFVLSWDGAHTAAAIISLLYMLIKTFYMVIEYVQRKKTQGDNANTSDAEQLLKEEQEEDTSDTEKKEATDTAIHAPDPVSLA